MNRVDVTFEDACALRALFVERAHGASVALATRLIKAKLAWVSPGPRGLLHISYRGRHALRVWDATRREAVTKGQESRADEIVR